MTLREHAIALVSVVIGLALTQLLSNLHDLVSARHRVRWHPLPLLWTGTAVGTVTNYWWGLFLGVTGVELSDSAGAFLATLVLPINIYFICAATLPKTRPEGEVDLLAHYLADSRYLMGVWLAYGVIASIQLNVVAGGVAWNGANVSRAGMMIVVLTLFLSRRVWVHCVGASLAFAGVIARLFFQAIH